MSFVFVCWHYVNKKKKSKCNSVELGDQVAIYMSGITDIAVRVSTGLGTQVLLSLSVDKVQNANQVTINTNWIAGTLVRVSMGLGTQALLSYFEQLDRGREKDQVKNHQRIYSLPFSIFP